MGMDHSIPQKLKVCGANVQYSEDVCQRQFVSISKGKIKVFFFLVKTCFNLITCS